MRWLEQCLITLNEMAGCTYLPGSRISEVQRASITRLLVHFKRAEVTTRGMVGERSFNEIQRSKGGYSVDAIGVGGMCVDYKPGFLKLPDRSSGKLPLESVPPPWAERDAC